MLSPHIYAALAQERHQTFLAQAETGGRNRRARLHRRQASATAAAAGRPVALRDGSAVLIRPVRRLLRNLRADLVRRERGALEYEIMLGSEGTGE
jgi:hypothetical protein